MRRVILPLLLLCLSASAQTNDISAPFISSGAKLAASDGYLAAAGNYPHFESNNPNLFSQTDDLVTMDASDPRWLRRVGWQPGATVAGVAATNWMVYTVSGFSLKVSRLVDGAVVLTIPLPAFARSIATGNGLLAVGMSSQVRTYNIADPANVVELATIPVTGNNGVAIRTGLLVTGSANGLATYNPITGANFGTFTATWSACRRVQLIGNRVYVAAAGTGLPIVDVSNPALPFLVRTAANAPGGTVNDVAAYAGGILTANGSAGARLLNVEGTVTNQAWRTGTDCQWLNVAGNTAYVGDASGITTLSPGPFPGGTSQVVTQFFAVSITAELTNGPVHSAIWYHNGQAIATGAVDKASTDKIGYTP